MQGGNGHQGNTRAGCTTQFPGPHQDKCELVVGLDLGTSCTKVVIQSPLHHFRWSHAVPFQTRSGWTSLIPTQLYYDPATGNTDLNDFPHAKVFQNLKLRFIDKPNQPVCSLDDGTQVSILDFSIAYIANILNKAREWLFANKADMFREYEIVWHLNMGIPSSNYESKYFGLYRTIALAGWQLSIYPEAIKLAQAKQVSQRIIHHEEKLTIQRDHVHIIPEVTAEVINYARSASRTAGLHFIIDVGASTLDMAGFELYDRGGKDNYSLIETHVRRLGAYRLHLNRLKIAKKMISDCYSFEEISADPSYRVPQTYDDYRRRFESITFSDHNSGFRKEVTLSIFGVLKALRQRSDPLHPSWKRGLPILLCGGGQHVDMYGEVLEEIGRWYLKHTRVAPFQIRKLNEKPVNFHGADVEFHRLVVAHGLSFPRREFGEIIPRHQVIKTPSSTDLDFFDKLYPPEEAIFSEKVDSEFQV